MTYLNSNHSEDMIGWKIVSRKNQALMIQKKRTNSTFPVLVTPPRSPPFRLNQGTKKSAGNVERGVWFGRRDSPGQLNNDDLSTNYHSRIHSITTIIMLTTVFVFIITLASAAILACWCRKHPAEKSSCRGSGKRQKRHAFASNLDDDFIPVKDDDDDDFDDDEDEGYDIETCEMREIIGRDSRLGVSDESESDCNSEGSGKSYMKLPCEEESNLIPSDPMTNGSTAESGAQIQGESSVGDLEKDPSDVLEFGIQGQSKFYLLKCIIPRLIRKLRRERRERGTTSADDGANEFHDFSNPTDSSYFLVNHSLAREKHSLKVRNLLDKFLFKFRLERRTKSETQEVFRLSRNDSNQSLL